MTSDAGSIRNLFVDRHAMLRQGLAGLVAVQPDVTLVAEAANGREATHQLRAHHPDLTLMDLQMPEMRSSRSATNFPRRGSSC